MELYRIVKTGEAVSVFSKKKNMQVCKRELIIEKLGCYESFAISVFNEQANVALKENDIVVCVLAHRASEFNGRFYNDITAVYLHKVSL